MLVGLCGNTCAGKTLTADYLVTFEGFHRITFAKNSNPLELIDQASSKGKAFESADALLDFVTKHWNQRWILESVESQSLLEQLQRRPFFLLVHVDAPVSLRWRRFVDRHTRAGTLPPDLNTFIIDDDARFYENPNALSKIVNQAKVHLLNTSLSVNDLHVTLRELALTDDQRLRPNWDSYFMQLASLAAQRSNCMKRRVGCVLVRDRRVISTGYNGTPRNIQNCNDGGCPRCNTGSAAGIGLSTCLCIHAEENALLEAGRERIREHSILYCDTCPCLTCSIKIAQVGIAEVVYSQEYGMDKDTATVFSKANIKLRQMVPYSRNIAIPLRGLDHNPQLSATAGASDAAR